MPGSPSPSLRAWATMSTTQKCTLSPQAGQSDEQDEVSLFGSYSRRFVLNTTFSVQPGHTVATDTGCDSLLLLEYAHFLMLSLGIFFKLVRLNRLLASRAVSGG